MVIIEASPRKVKIVGAAIAKPRTDSSNGPPPHRLEQYPCTYSVYLTTR